MCRHVKITTTDCFHPQILAKEDPLAKVVSSIGPDTGCSTWAGLRGQSCHSQVAYLLYFKTTVCLIKPVYSIHPQGFRKMMSRRIKGDALKTTLNGNSPQPSPPPELLSPTALICTLHVSSLSFIHASFSLSRRIYMRCCRAKVVSRLIPEFIGSGLLTCFGLCCLWNAEG